MKLTYRGTHKYSYLLALMGLLSSWAPLSGQNSLPHGLTEEERTRLNEIGINRTVTDPPDSVVFAPAEFDSLDGVIFAWDSFPTLLKQLIKETAEDDTAWVVVDDQNEQNYVNTQLMIYGVNMDQVVFQQIVHNSVWIRDYGPWWIFEPDGSRSIIDMVYNRPRIEDDAYPEQLANLWGIPYYGTALVEAGGNLLLDGKGAALISDIIFDPNQGFDPDLTVTLLEQYMLDYFGVHKVILTPHLQNDGTGHIDMFVKLLNDTTVIVGEYASPSSGSGDNYNICNQVAAQLAIETNGAGRPFNVERMLMPTYTGGITYTYINSLIVNKKVFVPVYGFTTDNAILAQYEQLLPGYEAIGFDCNSIITANGAIHCIAMKVPAMVPDIDPCTDWISGDVNNDDAIDIFDILLIVEYILENHQPDQCEAGVADFNNDNTLNVLDVVNLVGHIMGM
ncbi:MAG: agmatine deiminase family protein [Candidatus Marinimicrobia bacterium]|nr:agmatine deiminase family protein [Candidatus Neomarinimicrobiota bacterium]